MRQTLSEQEPCPDQARILPFQPHSRQAGELRVFIQALEDAGHLVRVKDAVDLRFELGAIARRRRIPLLFENIKGYPGQCVFTNGLCNTTAIALALRLGRLASRTNLIKETRRRILAAIKPVLVENGPVLENIVERGVVDLLKLPVPHWNNRDGSRYLGTWHINVSKDPQTGSRNVGVYRMQLLGPTRATVSASPRSHLAKHFAIAEQQGHSLPMAVAIGVSEAVIMAAGAAYPDAMDEFELAGGLQQEAVPLICCPGVNLEVPADSEIVIEGFIQPGVRVQDGPYLDYTGETNTNPHAFLFEATRLMFRNNPIFRGTSIGTAGAEDHQLFAFLAQLGLVDFHGSRIKQAAQNILLKRRLFRAFQLAGKAGAAVRSAVLNKKVS